LHGLTGVDGDGRLGVEGDDPSHGGRAQPGEAGVL
jgi:hypothetical protein